MAILPGFTISRISRFTVLFALAGCGLPDTPTETSGADGTESDADTSATTPLPPDPGVTSTSSASASATATTVDPAESSDEGLPFLLRPDGGSPGYECDLEAQDCEPGFKCMPYSSGNGGWWDATACFPVDPDPVGLGEPCEWEGEPWSGIDDCGPAQVCWSFAPGDGGVCKGLCLFETPGDYDTVSCEDPDAMPDVGCQECFCTCETQCDPLIQDCGDGQLCVASSDLFSCVPDASGEMGAYGDPCEYINACDVGMMCLNSDVVPAPSCEGATGCCTPFCDITLANTCPGAADGQECAPWYEPGGAPAGYEDVGVCALPL